MLISILLVAFLVVWALVYFLVIRPKLRSYRYTAGIYAKLDAWEAGFWLKFGLWLKGLKVAITGVVASSAPIATVAYQQASGFDWTKIMPTEKAQVVVGIIAVIGFLAPIVMVILHQGALADASASEPQK